MKCTLLTRNLLCLGIIGLSLCANMAQAAESTDAPKAKLATPGVGDPGQLKSLSIETGWPADKVTVSRLSRLVELMSSLKARRWPAELKTPITVSIELPERAAEIVNVPPVVGVKR